ncbi:unnamed protein product [Diatraea saccharalis]|uniref:Uncharacterized protein n=1 Tax=Diatraea saccharalis TaxID=40085 RepID=A0A9N9QYD0_9NEOP|nr:unnamed protein product [Diatraea saccharalis]
MNPVVSCNHHVAQLMEDGCRAKLISGIIGNPEYYPSNEFASYVQGSAKENIPACMLTSHANDNQRNGSGNVPTYVSLVQNLRWSPYVDMSSANNSQTNITEDKRVFKCKCDNCVEKMCPSRASLSNTKNRIFKDNIMTFSDQYTMTPRLNDVCCEVCMPVMATPKSSKVYVAIKSTECEGYKPTGVSQNCTPIPILKKSNCKVPSRPSGYCGPTTGHVPAGVRQEAVRDTDVTAEEDYCEPIKQKSYKSFFKNKKKTSFENDNPINDSGRKNIYNEGISDDVASFVPPVILPTLIPVQRDVGKITVRNECNDGIPYSHNSESKYHYHCKKSDLNSHYYTSDFDNVQYSVECPMTGRKIWGAKLPTKQYKAQRIALPRKLLTSEIDIDSYVERTRPAPVPPPACRRQRSKRFFK